MLIGWRSAVAMIFRRGVTIAMSTGRGLIMWGTVFALVAEGVGGAGVGLGVGACHLFIVTGMIKS